jgi:hypothetical protein
VRQFPRPRKGPGIYKRGKRVMFNIRDFTKQSERAIEMHGYLKAYTALRDKWVKLGGNLGKFVAESDYQGVYVTTDANATIINITLFDRLKIRMSFTMFRENDDGPFIGRMIVEEADRSRSDIFNKWFRYEFDQGGLLYAQPWKEALNIADERDAGNIFLHIFHDFKLRGLS